MRPSPLVSSRSAADLGEGYALAVLQTVASELLLLLQSEFDLLQPSPSKQPSGLQRFPDEADADAEGGEGGEGEGEAGGTEMPLHPSHLLNYCQTLLLARPESAHAPRGTRDRTASARERAMRRAPIRFRALAWRRTPHA